MNADSKALWRLLRPYARRYAIGGLILLACDLGQLGGPWIVGRIIDGLRLRTLTHDLLQRYVLLLLGLAVVVALSRWGWRFFVFGTARMVERDLRARLYSHLQTLSPAYYAATKIGDLMAHATNDVQAVRSLASEGVMAGMDSPIYLTAALLMMLSLDWHLTLAAIAPLPFIAIISQRLGSHVHRRYKEVQAAFSHLSDRVQETAAGVRIVKGFVQEGFEKERFARAAEAYRHKVMATERYHSGFDPVISVLSGISTALALGFGGHLVHRGNLSIGQLVTFLGLLNMLIWPMTAISWSYNLLQRAKASMGRLQEVFDTRPAVADQPGTVPLEGVAGGIRLRDLTFSYRPDLRPVLQGIDLDIAPGQVIGLVGRTGSGKSTLVSLLLRLYEPPAGTVFVDGRDVREIRLRDLRGAIAYVPQDSFLFSRSIARNVDFGPVPKGHEEVVAALDRAAMRQEAEAMPQGLETMLGERGITLSGGQRQRVSLARALAADAPILVLDDCLSAVDAETEKKILGELQAYMRGRTTLLVAHRLSIVRHAQRIVLLEDGRIAESGTHDELVALGGAYARMWEQQQLEAAIEQYGGQTGELPMRETA